VYLPVVNSPRLGVCGYVGRLLRLRLPTPRLEMGTQSARHGLALLGTGRSTTGRHTPAIAGR